MTSLSALLRDPDLQQRLADYASRPRTDVAPRTTLDEWRPAAMSTESRTNKHGYPRPSFAKRGDQWGVLVHRDDRPEHQQQITVTKRDGSKSKVVLWEVEDEIDVQGRQWCSILGICMNCQHKTSTLFEATDMSGIGGWVCKTCDADSMLSFY